MAAPGESQRDRKTEFPEPDDTDQGAHSDTPDHECRPIASPALTAGPCGRHAARVTTSRAAGEARLRTLVIGGTGFLGRHVCAELEAARHELLVVARDPSRHQGGLPFVSLDLARPSAVPELMKLFEAERPDVVVNAAGAVWAPTERELRECNVDLDRNLVTAIAAVPVRPRLVQLGSV